MYGVGMKGTQDTHGWTLACQFGFEKKVICRAVCAKPLDWCHGACMEMGLTTWVPKYMQARAVKTEME